MLQNTLAVGTRETRAPGHGGDPLGMRHRHRGIVRPVTDMLPFAQGAKDHGLISLA
jgi:hypothetical protein